MWFYVRLGWPPPWEVLTVTALIMTVLTLKGYFA